MTMQGIADRLNWEGIPTRPLIAKRRVGDTGIEALTSFGLVRRLAPQQGTSPDASSVKPSACHPLRR
jgi:hypothetical protein